MMRPAIKIRGYRNTSSTFSDDGRFHIFENGIRKQMTPIYDDRVDPQSEQILLGHFAASYLEYAFDRPLPGAVRGGIRYVIKNRQPFFGKLDYNATSFFYRIISVDSTFGKSVLTEYVCEPVDEPQHRLHLRMRLSEFFRRFEIPGKIASGKRLKFALSIATIVKVILKLKRLRNLVIERMYRPGKRGYEIAASSWGEHVPAASEFANSAAIPRTVEATGRHAKRRLDGE